MQTKAEVNNLYSTGDKNIIISFNFNLWYRKFTHTIHLSGLAKVISSKFN